MTGSLDLTVTALPGDAAAPARMRRQTPAKTSLLLLLALVAFQGLGVAHAFDHPLLDHADHACVVCAHGQLKDAGAPPAIAIPAPSAAAALQQPRAFAHPRAAAPRRGRCRDPPFPLV